jgi:hypothetical protein
VSVPVGTLVDIEATAPLDPATIDDTTLQLVQTATSTPVPVRSFVISGSRRSVSIVPDEALAFDTEYTLQASGAREIYGQLVQVPRTTLRTRDDAPPSTT